MGVYFALYTKYKCKDLRLRKHLDVHFLLTDGINGIVLPFVRVSLLINTHEEFLSTLSYDIFLAF